MDANSRRKMVTDEAARYWALLGTRPPDEVLEQEREQFTRWLRESPLHVAEMLHIARVHYALARFRGWSDVAVDPTEEASVVAMHPCSTEIPVRASGGRTDAMPVRGGPKTKWLAIAASLVAVLVGAVSLAPQISGQVIETERGERREVVLSDGSILDVDPQTRLRVKFEEHARRLYLEHGRALFHVAKNVERPFLVKVNDTTVRAVGTAFGIERRDASVIVTVSEGKVAVLTDPTAHGTLSSTSASGSGTINRISERYQRREMVQPRGQGEADGAIFLTAGQQVTVQKSGTAEPVRAVNPNRVLAWSEGRLVFDAVPLGEVVNEFNRYNRQQFQIEDAELALRPVSGVFQANDPETLIAFIRAGAPVVVRHADGEKILIVPRPPVAE